MPPVDPLRSSIAVRLARDADVQTVAASNVAMAKETEGRALDPHAALRGARAVLADRSKGFYLIAERGGGFAGQLLVTFEWSDWRDGTFWWIQSVYVDRSARRTGVYRALYEHVLERARREGACGVRLYVDRDNAAARATYEALGMEPTRYDLFEVDFVLGH